MHATLPDHRADELQRALSHRLLDWARLFLWQENLLTCVWNSLQPSAEDRIPCEMSIDI